jgi:HEAT repeat protein
MNEDDRRRLEEESDLLTGSLRRAGVRVRSVDDLVNSSGSYPDAIPVLLHWLPRAKHIALRESIVRALIAKESIGVAGSALIEIFLREPGDSPKSVNLKWVVGMALGTIASEADYDAIVSLVKDERHGWARAELPLALARVCKRRKETVEHLVPLTLSPEAPLALNAIRVLVRYKEQRARPGAERLAQHEDSWFRKRALAAIKQLDKAKRTE